MADVFHNILFRKAYYMTGEQKRCHILLPLYKLIAAADNECQHNL